MKIRTFKSEWLPYELDHIGVLDGIRVLAVLIVLWFHFWQQTWLMPFYPTPFLNWLGIRQIDFNVIRRCGFLCVDLMIMLSGFVLFLPYAKQIFLNTSVDSVLLFYRKRAARIIPSYLFAVSVMFLTAVHNGAYIGKSIFMWQDLLTHLTFTFMLRADTYLFSSINGVFWTVVIELLFYSFFPIFSRLFQRKPLFTYIGMTAVGLIFTFGYCLKQTNQLGFLVNRFLTFMPVFANGMLGAFIYVWYVLKCPNTIKWFCSSLGTVFAVIGVYILLKMFRSCAASKAIQNWQLTYRYPLSVIYLLVVLGFSVSLKPFRFLFANRLTASLSLITYNLYLWHQFLIVQLKLSFGCSTGADVAALGVNTQWMLNFEGLVVAFSVAFLTTFLLERPCRHLILKGSAHHMNTINQGE